MEEIIVSIDEHKLLKKFQTKLEAHFGIQICLPEVSKSNYCSNDVIVASISGECKNINYVKKFLERKMNKLVRRRQENCTIEGNIPVITLSESDSDNAVLAETQNKNKKKRKWKQSQEKKQAQYPQSGLNGNLTPMISMDKNACQISSTTFKTEFKAESSSSAAVLDVIDIPKDVPNSPIQEMDDSIVILSENINPPTIEHIPLISVPKDFPEKSHPQVTDDSIIILSEDINPPSIEYTPLNSIVTKYLPKESTSQSAADSIIHLSEDVRLPAAEYIPLRTVSQVVRKKKDLRKDDIALSDEVPIPRPKMRRILRPIVIDGSNIARAHGKSQNTFSCKGIKLSVEFFLKRGHTQVTALLPRFRNHCKYGMTDQDVLEKLEESQNVVFTPSRRVNGKMITCYDDRFIVDLAFKNNGVILSNDNYRDIIVVCPEYKKTIEERLLMFCFVGDLLMIPDDPLGRYGPRLDTFLSMEETINNEIQSNSLQVTNQMSMDQILRNTNSSSI